MGKKERISEVDLLKISRKVARSSDQLIDIINASEKGEDIKIHNKELKEVRNFDDNFDSFEQILRTLDNLEGVQTYDYIFKNFYFNIISKLRMVKNTLKNLLAIL